MKAIKAIFMGMPAKDMQEYIPLLSRIKPGVFSKEDGYKLQKMMRKNVLLKLVCLPISITTGYFIPIPADFTAPIIPRCLVALMGYRILTVPFNVATLDLIKELVIKYDLKNKPELLRQTMEQKSKEAFDKMVKEYEEEKANKKEGEPMESFEQFKQRKEDDFEKLVLEYEEELKQKKETDPKESFREFLERKKKEKAGGNKEEVKVEEIKASTEEYKEEVKVEENKVNTEENKESTEAKKD